MDGSFYANNSPIEADHMGCPSAEKLTSFTWLPFVLLFKFLCCICGVLATFAYAKKQGFSWLVHPNAKLLYCFHTFWALYVPFFFSIAHGFDGVRLLLYHTSACDLLVPAVLPITLRALPFVGIIAQSFTMCSFAVERLIATLNPAKYETIKTFRLGLALAVLSIVIAFLEEFLLILSPIHFDRMLPITTLRTKDNWRTYRLFIYSYTIVETLTISLFIFSWFINHRRQLSGRYGNALGTRYQARENDNLIRTLLPCFGVHFALNFLLFLMLNLYFELFDYEMAWFSAWEEIFGQVHMYSLIMPIIIQLRLLKQKSRTVVVANDPTLHFRQLHTMFNKA